MLDILQYGFMQKALLTGVLTGISCSLLGVFLVLRRYALIGDGIAHIAFGGVAFGLLFGVMPIIGAFIFAVFGGLGILYLKENAKISGDTSIGILSHSSLGIGVFIASIASGFNVDILSYLFGSILAIKNSEVILSGALAIFVILTIVFFYHDLFYMTFDEESAKASGVKVNLLNIVLILLTSLTVVGSMRVVGLLLVSALIILPAASALLMNMSFKRSLFFSAIISSFSIITGLMISYLFDFAPSGTIVLINTVIFLFIYLLKKILSQFALKTENC